MLNDASLVSAVSQKLEAFGPDQALSQGISGIDGSGKGYVTAKFIGTFLAGLIPATSQTGFEHSLENPAEVSRTLLAA